MSDQELPDDTDEDLSKLFNLMGPKTGLGVLLDRQDNPLATGFVTWATTAAWNRFTTDTEVNESHISRHLKSVFSNGEVHVVSEHRWNPMPHQDHSQLFFKTV